MSLATKFYFETGYKNSQNFQEFTEFSRYPVATLFGSGFLSYVAVIAFTVEVRIEVEVSKCYLGAG